MYNFLRKSAWEKIFANIWLPFNQTHLLWKNCQGNTFPEGSFLETKWLSYFLDYFLMCSEERKENVKCLFWWFKEGAKARAKEPWKIMFPPKRDSCNLYGVAIIGQAYTMSHTLTVWVLPLFAFYKWGIEATNRSNNNRSVYHLLNIQNVSGIYLPHSFHLDLAQSLQTTHGIVPYGT